MHTSLAMGVNERHIYGSSINLVILYLKKNKNKLSTTKNFMTYSLLLT